MFLLTTLCYVNCHDFSNFPRLVFVQKCPSIPNLSLVFFEFLVMILFLAESCNVKDGEDITVYIFLTPQKWQFGRIRDLMLETP